MAECKHSGELTITGETPKIDEKQFSCGICISNYNTPRYLPTCGHTFCENCLLKYVRNSQQEAIDGQGSKFDCPVCRKPNNLPAHDEVTLQWIQTFPLNTVIIKMMEVLPQSSEETKEERRMCDPCNEEGETNVGLKYCLDCKEVLCKVCTKYHKNFKISKDHKLIDVREVSSEAGHAQFFNAIGKCTVHPERDVEIYCKTHDAVVCTSCLISDHKTCELTELVNHDIDVNKLQKDSDMLVSQMETTIEHLNLLQKLRVEIKNNTKQKLKEIREHVEQVRDQIVELMNKVVSHIAEVTKQIEIEKEDGIDAEMAKVTKLKDITEQNVALLNTIEQHGSKKHKFVSAHLLNMQFEETSRQICKEDKQIKQLDIELVIADDLKRLIESTDVAKLVQIKVTESESNHTPLASISNVLQDSPRLVKVEEHTVPPGCGSGPWYSGVTILRDGRVAFCRYYNYELYLYNPANKTMLKLSLPKRPWGVVEIDDGRLAVNIPENKTITVVSVDNDILIEKTLKSMNTPGSIVALSNGQLAVAWKDPRAFSVIDISGTEIVQKSYLDQDIRGRKFKSFDYMAVDERRQHVIQPCTKDKAVYCFDFVGKQVFTYTDPELTYPQGVALDKCGNIYVCEPNKPGSIHKLSPTGDPISVFTKDIPSKPQAICSDIAGTGFWVTRDSEPSNSVVYYRLDQITTP